MIRMTEDLKMTDSLFVFRNCILEDLMKMGYKYIARDRGGAIYAFSSKPIRREKAWIIEFASVDGKLKNISLVSRMFADIKWEDVEPFKIPYVNWDNVPVDTKVIVTGVDGSEWHCHFYHLS